MTVAAIRSCWRGVVPDLVEQLVGAALAGVQRRDQASLPVQPMRDVLVELGGGIVDRRPVPRADHRQLAPAQLRQAVEVGGQRPGVGRDEHASFAEHRVAGQSHVADDIREVVRRVAGGRDRFERPHPACVGKQYVDVSAGRRQRRPRKPRPHRQHRLGVVGVVVGQDDPAQTTAALDLLGQRGEVLVERRVRGRPARPDRGRRPTSWCPTA